MLQRLEINNLAVISHAVFEPETGFNVISGETGAGKSLLIDAIGLIMGQKANRDIIRTGETATFVEAVFDLSDSSDIGLNELLDENGIDYSDNLLIISRQINSEGRSVARINGRTVILSLLRNISEYLIDIHGQHDTQVIFNEKEHLRLLDEFGAEKIKTLYDNYLVLLNEYKEIVLRIKEIAQSPDALQKRKSYLEFVVDEISNANLHETEEEELHNRRKELLKNERIGLIVSQLNEIFSGEEGSATSLMSEAVRYANELLKEGKEYEDLSNRIISLGYELDSASDEIYSLSDSLGFDPEELSEINSRIGLIYDLKSKYGKDVKEILSFLDKARAELDGFSEAEEVLKKLKDDRQIKEKKLLEAARLLSEARHSEAEVLSNAISRELSSLEMPNSRFVVRFTERPRSRYFSSNGTEDISFEFSSNMGESLKSLAATASGGEASRIMLAIKTVLSSVDKTPTLIFDEIDTGISGNASVSVANKLKAISCSHQVLCVSHTAQIAAAANNNFFLSKSEVNGRTETTLELLDTEKKIDEVSRLLSGIRSTESIELAKHLIDSFV